MIAATPPLALLQLRQRKIMSAKGDPEEEGQEEVKKKQKTNFLKDKSSEGREEKKKSKVNVTN